MHGWLDPTVWVGFLALVALETVLASGHAPATSRLTESVPAPERDRVRLMGLISSLAIRLVLLMAVVWLIQFNAPVLWLGSFGLSVRDTLLILGGFYLLFRATLVIYGPSDSEPRARLGTQVTQVTQVTQGIQAEQSQSVKHDNDSNQINQINQSEQLGNRSDARLDTNTSMQPNKHLGFEVLQWVYLSLTFSVAMVMVAISLVDRLPIMAGAAIVALLVSRVAHAWLMRFVSAYPAVVLLCAGVLLVLGFSMLTQGLGFEVPRDLLLVVIGFMALVAWLLHGMYPKASVAQGRLPMRQRTVQAIARLLGKKLARHDVTAFELATDVAVERSFAVEERNMVSGVLTLAERSVHSIMTPRTSISWINLDDEPEHIKNQLEEDPHSYFPVCRGSLDEVIGIGRAKRMVADILTHGHIRRKRLREPIIIHDTISISGLLDTLKRAKGQLVLVADEFGTLQGLVTPIDIFEAIAGEFPDEDETPDIVSVQENRWRMDGATDLHHLEQVLDATGFVDEDDEFTTLAGYLLNHFGQLPKLGEICEHEAPEAIFTFEVARIEGRRIALVNVAKQVLLTDQGLGEKH